MLLFAMEALTFLAALVGVTWAALPVLDAQKASRSDGRGEKETSTVCKNKSSLKVRHFRRVRFKDRVERTAHRFALANRSRLLNLPCTHVAATSIQNGHKTPVAQVHHLCFTQRVSLGRESSLSIFLVPLFTTMSH